MHQWLAFLWYEFLYVIFHFVALFSLSLRTEGRKNVPHSGPVLLVANHQSSLDPLVICLSTRRHISFLARKSLFRYAPLAALMHSLDTVPINHEGVGKEGLQEVIRRLEEGRAVVVFPEGTRTDDGTINPFRAGVSLILARVRPAVVPVGIAGAFQAWPHWRLLPIPAFLFLPGGGNGVAVSVGRPLDGARLAALPRDKALQELFQIVHALVQRAEKLRLKR